MSDNDAVVTAERCVSQLLSGPPGRGVLEVVRRLLAVQGQDQRGARLAIRARSAGLTAADVDRALTDDRSLLITWLNRGTLHLVAAEDYWWLHALTAHRMMPWVATRMKQEGVESQDQADKAAALIDAALAAEGPLTRAQLADLLVAAGIPTAGQALVHLLAWTSVHGVMVRGPMAGRQQAFVRVADWLGPRPARFDPARFDRAAALAELARRYLAGHGPANEADLAKWAGLTKGDARAGMSAIAAELGERADGMAELAAGSGKERPGPGPVPFPLPRLLGPFDPLLHGWVDREPILGPHKHIVTVNGLFRSFALADGHAVATWTMPGGTVELAPFDPLPESVAAALRNDAADVVRFLG
jgi:Winged helix DNA-binding domain